VLDLVLSKSVIVVGSHKCCSINYVGLDLMRGKFVTIFSLKFHDKKRFKASKKPDIFAVFAQFSPRKFPVEFISLIHLVFHPINGRTKDFIQSCGNIKKKEKNDRRKHSIEI
jgi:hypothetical protein